MTVYIGGAVEPQSASKEERRGDSVFHERIKSRSLSSTSRIFLVSLFSCCSFSHAPRAEAPPSFLIEEGDESEKKVRYKPVQ
eukprot:764289-Hanusia_phi.AAC.7